MASAELRGLRALVTGASKGIGHAVANRLHRIASFRIVPPP